jgi:nucleotide-binding universal stress UspA family protein
MSHVIEVAPRLTTRLLVATDGLPDADGAVRVGRALAQRDGTVSELVSIVEPLPLPGGPDGLPLPDPRAWTDLMRDSRAELLLAQRDRTHPAVHEWPFDIDAGPRAEMIVANARRRGATLVVVGLGEHGVAARLSARETAIQVIRASSIPVLAVPRDGWGVPHTALAAADFTRSSERAAAAALELLGGEGTLYLAHVLPRTAIPHAEPRGWEHRSEAVLPRLEAMARRLAPPRGVQIEYVLLHGDPAHELLEFARQTKIDLVAAGAHGRSALERLLLGSVSTRLVRAAECCILVAPADPTIVPATDDEDAPNDLP